MLKHTKVLIDVIREHLLDPKRGAEIGVYRGLSSCELLRAFPDCHMTFVDPWKAWDEGESYRQHKRTGSLSQKEWDEIYAEALENIMSAGNGKYTIIRQESEVASKVLPHSDLDFVFIDADHTYEKVKKDIEVWYPLVRDGGLVIGHDYGGPYKGVKRAVDEYFGEEQITHPRSRIWYIKKGVGGRNAC